MRVTQCPPSRAEWGTGLSPGTGRDGVTRNAQDERRSVTDAIVDQCADALRVRTSPKMALTIADVVSSAQAWLFPGATP